MCNQLQPRIVVIGLCLVIVLVLLTSCSETIEREKLVGRYTWNDGRSDTLEVNADGTYEYWTFRPGQKIANSGKWKLDSVLNQVEFERENFPFLENHIPEGSWFSKIRSADNEIYLMYAKKRNSYLKKIKTLGG